MLHFTVQRVRCQAQASPPAQGPCFGAYLPPPSAQPGAPVPARAPDQLTEPVAAVSAFPLLPQPGLLAPPGNIFAPLLLPQQPPQGLPVQAMAAQLLRQLMEREATKAEQRPLFAPPSPPRALGEERDEGPAAHAAAAEAAAIVAATAAAAATSAAEVAAQAATRAKASQMYPQLLHAIRCLSCFVVPPLGILCLSHRLWPRRRRRKCQGRSATPPRRRW